MLLAGVGCAAAFFGAAQLENSGPAPASVIPLAAGVVLLAALIVHQYRARQPLMPVRQLTTTFPACGILIAMTASASAIGLMELVLTTVQRKDTPIALALQVPARVRGRRHHQRCCSSRSLFRTRFTPVLAISGVALVAVAAALLTGLATGGSAPCRGRRRG